MKLWPSIVLSGLALPVSTAWAQDRADLDPMRIVGNRELPSVVYIVPWKKPLPGEANGRPMASVLDEALAPLDRDVFRRQMKYDSQLHPAAQTAAAAPK